MNISSAASPAQYATMNSPSTESAAVVDKVLDQEKTDGQDTVELIASAAPPRAGSLSVYA